MEWSKDRIGKERVMKLKDFISETKVYDKAAGEIKNWIEESYPGLSIIYEPRLEVVRTDENIDFDEERVPKIVEAINIKIGDILEQHAEEIYIAERLTRIWQNHPRFNIDVESIQDIKDNKKFCKYLKELIITPKQIEKQVMEKMKTMNRKQRRALMHGKQ